jgi:hypothetical protein
MSELMERYIFEIPIPVVQGSAISIFPLALIVKVNVKSGGVAGGARG